MAEEKRFENKVKRFLKDKGCWNLKTWSNGVQRSGVPDLLVCCNGRFIGVELKASNGRPSDLQLHNLKTIDAAGGFAILLYPDQYLMFKLLVDLLGYGYLDGEAREVYETLKRRWVDADNAQLDR